MAMKDPHMPADELTTNRKAFLINLDEQIYGTFAEIGAGQEVAGNFFKAGGAAGTVAKSMSAYDMKFSDEIYGKARRYVSKERMVQMLEHEYGLLGQRLADRADNSSFFVFADTVAAASYQYKKECHGWLGIRYQVNPTEKPNDIYLHVRMLDRLNQDQQEALGIVGVNLIWAALQYFNDIDRFITSLPDAVGDRVEIDMLQCHGPYFDGLKNSTIALKLVEHGLTHAVMFGPNEQIIQPSEGFYKKAVIVERGSFRPVTHVNIDMMNGAGSQFVQEENVKGEEVVALFEITIKNLLGDNASIDYDDFHARVEIITALGYNVLVSNYMEYYRLSSYFRRYTDHMVGIVLGINHLQAIFTEEYYQHLDGGILESFGRLFKANVRMYVYPMKGSGYQNYIVGKDGSTGGGFSDEMVITADNLKVKSNLRHLYAYLVENHFIEPVIGASLKNLDIFSREVLKQIAAGDPAWEEAVPDKVANLTKERGYWGYSKLAESQKAAQS